MLDVCFGDSECGALRLALNKKKDEVVFSFHLLDLGKIDKDNFILARKQWMDSFFSGCSKRERKKILKDSIKRFEKIIKTAKQGEALRIWYASAPRSKSGYYHLIYNLQGIDCPIFVVEMPTNVSRYPSEDEDVDHSWWELQPWDMQECVCLQRELSLNEREAIALKWEKLAKENADLRLNIHGELTSVPVDYLDEEIMSYAPKGEFKMARLVGETLGNCRHAISDGFVVDRIEALIEKNQLTVVKHAGKKEDYYRDTILRRL